MIITRITFERPQGEVGIEVCDQPEGVTTSFFRMSPYGGVVPLQLPVQKGWPPVIKTPTGEIDLSRVIDAQRMIAVSAYRLFGKELNI